VLLLAPSGRPFVEDLTLGHAYRGGEEREHLALAKPRLETGREEFEVSGIHQVVPTLL
jgi:hypothetical protein